MANDSNNTRTGGITFLDALGLLLIALRLMGYIDWAWWLVLLPIWLPFGIIAAGFAVAGVLWVIGTILQKLGK